LSTGIIRRITGYNRVQLHAELDNEKAHNLYKKLGFTQEEIMFFMKKI